MAQHALELTTEGQVLLRLRRPWRDGTRAIRFEPSELLEKLAAMIPRPRANLLKLHGHVRLRGQDIYAAKVDPVRVRRRIGMVFQQPNPFAMSIFNNVSRRSSPIAIVTHNLQQAKRVADMTGFLYVDTSGGGRTGYLVEYGRTEAIFENPKEKHTQDYIRGEFS